MRFSGQGALPVRQLQVILLASSHAMLGTIFMGIPRKDALKRLRGLAPKVEYHLELVAADPDDQATPHHLHEIGNWLQQMEEALRHVGTKTAAEWEARVRAWRANLPGEPEA
jgi:hypothetical protein